MNLVQEMRSAVSQALIELVAGDAWRTYLGEHQDRLCAELNELLGCPHVGLASSGTVALELLLRACRLETGDEVLLAGYDYPGNFAAIERVGARPALVDVAADSWRLDWESLNRTYSTACRVLIASHLHGQLQEVERLQQWCRERGVWFIQDACQALGANIGGRRLGQCADATFISFGGSKTISAGRGGAWSTSDNSLAQLTRVSSGTGSGAYQMSELQSAVVLAQLPYLERITQATRAHFETQLREMRVRMPALTAPWENDLIQTAFFQAGWLWPAPGDTQQDAEPPDWMREHTGWGKGFDGFHRRSIRRCRMIAPLINTASIVARTRTMHHRVALA